MVAPSEEKISVRSFSRAFEQMCNFIAVANTGRPNETIKGLAQLCFVVMPGEYFDSARKIADSIDTLFGVRIPEHQVQVAINDLMSKRILSKPAATNFVLAPEARAALLCQVDDARSLEGRVKNKWIDDIASRYTSLPIDKMWGALQVYLSRAFRRHGIQAAALLDPTIDTTAEYYESLSVLLDEVLKDSFEQKNREIARQAISGFLAEVGSDVDRTRYITRLADGAFNFYTLEVAPDVAEQLRSKLTELTLFLDTNFLFGILDLHINIQVEISRELIRAAREYKLPFLLRYHQVTEREMRSTILHYGSILRARHWPSHLSSAAARSKNLSGIEQKYHERNAVSSIEPDDFLRPYEHFDVLLKNDGIDVYRPAGDRLQACTDLYKDYQDFLTRNHKGEKPYEIVFHDATVLDAVRQKRSRAKSSLEAGALLVTCDYMLYRFDWESSRKNGQMASVLMPNILWQILRPFIPSGQDFDKSFAETFALPEFRVIGSGGSMACSRMLKILSSYKDVPEETAFKMLSNDVLLDRLRTVKDDAAFHEIVEAEFIQENQNLLEENAALARTLEQEKKDRAAREKKYQEQAETDRRERESLLREKEELARKVAQAKGEVGKLQSEVSQQQEEARKAVSKAKAVEQEKAQIDKAVREEAAKLERAEKRGKIVSGVAAVSVTLFFAVSMEWIVGSGRWIWLRDHSNSLGLRGSFYLFFVAGLLGIFVPKWRKACWGGGLLPLVYTILQIIGK